ncbi:zinc finger CCCH domain-containing protein 15-like [Watersipora subatra]|uniref:zinc finger CCCH domain-containing protein 15-like n=1 Tax=Watersipora subatra TaxID=2589382 RepID=UPI00355ADD23
MPPKKKDAPSKKTEQKQKAKVIEDKTFGLKNKKGTKQQKFIQQVQKQVLTPHQKASQEQTALQKKKDEEAKKKAELNNLFRPVQTVSKGADPKSVLCAFFKQGNCGKGAKCKFSHDLTVEKKTEKRSVYSDGKDEDMDGWDQAKLEDVVDKKHGSKNKGLPPTTIICKHFLEALESSKYGWFWECPGGEKCHYKHALPPGYVLAKDKKKMEEQKESITLEDLIERERAKLEGNQPKITLESFLAWKTKKRNERIKKDKAANEKKKADFKQGKMFGVSGRDLFTFNPDLVAGDDDEADDTTYIRERDTDEEALEMQCKEIDLSEFAYSSSRSEAPAIAADISVDTGERFADLNYTLNTNGTCSSAGRDNEENKMNMAAAATDEAIAAAMAATIDDAGPIDENLFDGDDIDELDDDLEELTL